MSRSYKKHPIIANACKSDDALAFFKKRSNGIVRRCIDVGNGAYYKRLDDNWMWPGDGKHWCDNQKAYRK